MFSTGKIGLWSIIEEGIGIIAGSLPALRPLLSLPMFNSTTASKSNMSAPGNKYGVQSNSRHALRSDVHMDTFQQLGKSKDGEADEDGDSQKHILKETNVTIMRNDRSGNPDDWERSQVLGWK